jgi:hypothetical protein
VLWLESNGGTRRRLYAKAEQYEAWLAKPDRYPTSDKRILKQARRSAFSGSTGSTTMQNPQDSGRGRPQCRHAVGELRDERGRRRSALHPKKHKNQGQQR